MNVNQNLKKIFTQEISYTSHDIIHFLTNHIQEYKTEYYDDYTLTDLKIAKILGVQCVFDGFIKWCEENDIIIIKDGCPTESFMEYIMNSAGTETMRLFIRNKAYCWKFLNKLSISRINGTPFMLELTTFLLQ